MPSSRIILSGMSPKIKGLRWESPAQLRIGSQNTMDIVLADPSVKRRHAVVQLENPRWTVHSVDVRCQTRVNGQSIADEPHTLRERDLLQIGNLTLQVSSLETDKQQSSAPAKPATSNDSIRTTGSFVRVQASTNRTWDEALEQFALNTGEQPKLGEALLTLLRTGQHVSQVSDIEELVHSVLADVVTSLSAQRGSLVLAHPLTGELQLRAAINGKSAHGAKHCFSRTLANRCFTEGQSLLCRDVRADEVLQGAQSVRKGTMSSIICALLRSPRQRLGVLQLDRGIFEKPFTESDLVLTDAIAASVSVGIESALLVRRQQDEFIQTVTTLARTVEMRDQYTGDHTKRVTDYALMLAEALDVSAKERDEIRIGTPLHDIGKIGVDDAILRKPGRLTDPEFESMKLHTIKGAHMLGTMYSLESMIPIVRHHHEKWDGSGYPDGLTGEQIATTARIVAIADAFDAMTSDRPYRPALPIDAVFAEIESESGRQFDPNCVRAFLRMRTTLEQLIQ